MLKPEVQNSIRISHMGIYPFNHPCCLAKGAIAGNQNQKRSQNPNQALYYGIQAAQAALLNGMPLCLFFFSILFLMMFT